MQLDHIALNAVSLDEEIEFFVNFLGLRLLQRWDNPRQAYVGLEEGPVIGLIEHPYDSSQVSMVHVAFTVPEAAFDEWVTRVAATSAQVVTGPKPQRGGRTILFRSPSGNIVELCYPYVRTTIANERY